MKEFLIISLVYKNHGFVTLIHICSNTNLITLSYRTVAAPHEKKLFSAWRATVTQLLFILFFYLKATDSLDKHVTQKL